MTDTRLFNYLSNLVTPAFIPFWKTSNSHHYLKYVLKGGRGSGKSTHVSLRMIKDIMKYPVTGLCVRKVARTLEESMFEQLKEAIIYLQVEAHWKVNLNPLKLTYTPRGNSILFRGADDPLKIKSLKVSKFPVSFMWIEELSEFKTEEEVSTIENSVLRAELPEGLFYAFYYTYNPPKRKQNWVNKKYETQFLPKNTVVFHSDYQGNPFISEDFKEEAEGVRKANEFKYRWEYLGEPIGSGIVPFANLSFREITEEEVNRFDNIRQGVDWGYGPDPFSFGRWHLDKTRRRLYALDEIHEVKLSNRDAAQRIKEKGYNDVEIIADSSEPKSIDEMRIDYGVWIRGARKGAGSVEFGEKWLDDLEEIVIDPNRTPKTAKEFEDIDYEVDRDGNPKARLEDKNNHSVDQCRYALEHDMRNPLGPVNVRI